MIGRSKDGKPVLAADLIGREDVMSILYDIEEKLSETEYILNTGNQEIEEWRQASKYATRDFSAYTFLAEKYAALFDCLRVNAEGLPAAERAAFWFSMPETEAGVEIPLSFEKREGRKTIPFHTISPNGRDGKPMSPKPIIWAVEAKGARLFVQTVLFFMLEEERVLRDIEGLDSTLSFEFFKQLMQIKNRRGTGRGVPAGVLLTAVTKASSEVSGTFQLIQEIEKGDKKREVKKGSYERTYRANFIGDCQNYWLQDCESNMEADQGLRGLRKRFVWADISPIRFRSNTTKENLAEKEWYENAHGPEYLAMLSLVKGNRAVRSQDVAEDRVNWHEQDYAPAVLDLVGHFAYGQVWRRLLNMAQAAQLCRLAEISRSACQDSKTDYSFYDPYLYRREEGGIYYGRSLRRFATLSFFEGGLVRSGDVDIVERELFAASGNKGRYAFIPPEEGAPRNREALTIYREGISRYFSHIAKTYKTEGRKTKRMYKEELKWYRKMLSDLARWLHKAVRKKEAGEEYLETDRRDVEDAAYIDEIAKILKPYIEDIGEAVLHSGKDGFASEDAYLKMRLFLSEIRSLSPGVFEELCRCLKLEEVFGQDKRSGARDAISAYFNANRENEESFCHLFSTSTLVIGGLKNKRLKREMEEKVAEEFAKLLTEKLSDSDGTAPEYGEVEKWLEGKGELFLMGMDMSSLRLWQENPHKFGGPGEAYLKSLKEKMESSWKQLAVKTDVMDFDGGCSQPFL